MYAEYVNIRIKLFNRNNNQLKHLNCRASAHVTETWSIKMMWLLATTASHFLNLLLPSGIGPEVCFVLPP